MDQRTAHALEATHAALPPILRAGSAGIDAGMTMTKVVRATAAGVEAWAVETRVARERAGVDGERRGPVGVTGARAALLAVEGETAVQEIDAAARGCGALLEAGGMDGGTPYVMALLGTGTAFAAVRDGSATHLGGTALGGGSFAALARRVSPGAAYAEIVEMAGRGDRTRADVMVSEVYEAGIGRIGPELTAAHLAKAEGWSTEDFLAGLLNLHGESIGQIAAGRARLAGVQRVVLCGGFVHGNAALVASIAHMAGLFGNDVSCVPHPGFAGAIGAALVAAAAR